jgi:hypothetical protein
VLSFRVPRHGPGKAAGAFSESAVPKEFSAEGNERCREFVRSIAKAAYASKTPPSEPEEALRQHFKENRAEELACINFWGGLRKI